MKWAQVQSEAINAIGYDSATQTLGVKFSRGAEYHYFHVPSSVHAQFMSASSHGTFHHKYIKSKYRYRRIRG
jgi:hypothetical protein